jgi:hypothetical protein
MLHAKRGCSAQSDGGSAFDQFLLSLLRSEARRDPLIELLTFFILIGLMRMELRLMSA